MKLQKKRLILFVNIIISFYFAAISWNSIEFIYNDPGIIGIYSENEYNSLNDVVRYIVFISFPIFLFFLTKGVFKKDFVKKIQYFSTSKDISDENKTASWTLFFIVLTIFLLEFFSVSFPDYYLDSFHEGQKLSSAYKNLVEDSLWSGSYVTIGIFPETLLPRFFWDLFNTVSIGLTRYIDIFFILILKIFITLMIFTLTSFVKLNQYSKNIFFLLNVFIVSFFCDYIPGVDLISYREIPIIVFLILFLLSIRSGNHIIFLILISSLSVLSMLWGIDRGLVCNLLILIFTIYLLGIKEYKKIIFFFVSTFLAWLTFYIIAENEFYHFFTNTFSIYKEMNYIHGLIHPTPFSDEPNASRATKTLISIILVALLSVNLIFRNSKNYSLNFKRFLIILSIVSIFSYLYALGRSDGPHIKNSFGYPLIFLTIYFSYSLLLIFSKKEIKSYKNIFPVSFLILFLISFEINYKNIINYKHRFENYINLDDKFFLNSKELLFIEKAKPIVKEFNCIQLLSNDAALYYLLKKKSCTKYYYVWSATSKNNQKNIINDMESTKLIIEGGPRNNWDIPLKRKLFMVYEYMDKEFYLIEEIQNWNIFLRK